MARQTESRQIEVLRYIHEQVTQKGYPPTVREIGEAVQLSSTSTVHGHLARLEKKGFIQRDPTKPRAIELTKQGLEKIGIRPTTIPVLGVVTAGEPILAVEDASDFFPIPPNLSSEEGSLFMLTIRGDSMINAGIDRHLAVRPQISVQAVGHPEILPVRVRVPEAGLQLQIAQLHKLLFADLVRRAPVDA